MRPANVLTSIADGLAGWSVLASLMPAEVLQIWHLPFLLLAHALLYAGGIMMNDVFDAKLDAIQRPERPIPKKLLTKEQVKWVAISFQFGAVLLCLGLDYWYSVWSILIIAATYLYNGAAKNHPILGPASMGLCRSLNFLLPLSLSTEYLAYALPIALLPLVYIAGITLSSRYEVEGGGNRPQLAAMVLYAAVMIALSDLAIQHPYNWLAYLFIAGFMVWLLPKAYFAWKEPKPLTIRAAVRAGVLGLLWYDGAVAVIFNQWAIGFGIVLLLPICIWLGKKYSVT